MKNVDQSQRVTSPNVFFLLTTQRYSAYCHRGEKELDNVHIYKAGIRDFHFFSPLENILNWFLVWCQKIVKKSLPELKMTSLNYLFGLSNSPKLKDIQLTLMWDKWRQQIITFEKLEQNSTRQTLISIVYKNNLWWSQLTFRNLTRASIFLYKNQYYRSATYCYCVCPFTYRLFSRLIMWLL